MPPDNENDHKEDRWTVVFYGKYYTFYTDLVGEKRHLCMCVSEDAQHYHWEEYNISSAYFGRRVPWGRVPAALQELIQDEYRKDIPGYRAKGLLQSPDKYEQNRKNYGDGRRK
jgi:hypothetical protein